jgi:hypothetical protein
MGLFKATKRITQPCKTSPTKGKKDLNIRNIGLNKRVS